MLWKYCKNCVHLSFLKKKKEKKSGMELWQWYCRIPFYFSQFLFFLPPYFGNGIATNQLQIFFPSYFDNAIAIILLYFLKKFFFFKEMVSAHNFYNIFTTNFKWQVVIVRLKKNNLSVKFKFELIITNHMWFVVKMLWKYYGCSTYFLIPPQISVTTFFFVLPLFRQWYCHN